MQTCSTIGSLHQEKTDPPSKNRVWDFFCVTYSCTGAISPQVAELHQETSSCTTVIVSGVVEWLSKDPIGINGGLNQYVAFGNNPVMFIDPLGLRGNPISGGGTEIYYPNGGWISGIGYGATFEHRTTSGFANVYRLYEGAIVAYGGGAVIVGGAAAAYYGGPYIVAGGAAVFTTGQNALYKFLSWQPMAGFDSGVLYYPQSPPVRATLSEVLTGFQPYAGQLVAGVVPGPPNPVTTTGWGPLGEAFLYGLGNAISPFNAPSLDSCE